MLESFFNTLIHFIFYIIGRIGNLLFNPVIFALQLFVPQIGDFVNSLLNFFNLNIFPVVCWLKRSFLGITHMSGAVWSFLVLQISLLISAAIAFRAVRLIYNLWKTYRGTVK